MRRLMSLLIAGILASSPLGLVAGCEDRASREIEIETKSPDGHRTETEIEKKTVVEPDGDRKTTIEIETEEKP